VNIIFFVGAVLVLLGGWVVFFGAPYVPSRTRDVTRVFDELYHLTDQDTLVDIGSGDGVVLQEAEKRGARAIGYEINPVLVVISRLRLRGSLRTRVLWRNMWWTSLPQETTVIYVFGESRDIDKIGKWIDRQTRQLQKTIYVVSYGFSFSDRQPLRRIQSHMLYQFTPLQNHESTVS
jgi:hypothetical protein